MTSRNPDNALSDAWPDELPEPHVLLARTDWTALQHARGSAADLPAGPALFLDDSLTVRTEAIGRWLEVVNHQNSIYRATTPVACYVAALLADPRTAELKVVEVIGGRPAHPPVRAMLIDWLGSIADEASDTVVANMQRLGFDEYPEMEELRSAQRRCSFSTPLSSVIDAGGIRAARARCVGDQCRRLLPRSRSGRPGRVGLGHCHPAGGRAAEVLLAAHPGLQRLARRPASASRVPRCDRRAVPERSPGTAGGAAIRHTHRPHLGRSQVSERLLQRHPPPGHLRAHTADGVPLLAAIAGDDRVPGRHRFDAVDLLFDIATVSHRHRAQCWPDLPPHMDAASEEAARTAVHAQVSELLARWGRECPAVRLALAAFAVVSPTERTLAALTPRLKGFIDRHAAGTDIGDYARFVLVLAAGDDGATLATVESLTEACWKGTARDALLHGRALHLLQQMLANVNIGLAAC